MNCPKVRPFCRILSIVIFVGCGGTTVFAHDPAGTNLIERQSTAIVSPQTRIFDNLSVTVGSTTFNLAPIFALIIIAYLIRLALLFGPAFEDQKLYGNSYSGNSYSGNAYSGNSYSGNSYSGNSYSGNSYSAPTPTSTYQEPQSSQSIQPSYGTLQATYNDPSRADLGQFLESSLQLNGLASSPNQYEWLQQRFINGGRDANQENRYYIYI